MEPPLSNTLQMIRASDSAQSRAFFGPQIKSSANPPRGHGASENPVYPEIGFTSGQRKVTQSGSTQTPEGHRDS